MHTSFIPPNSTISTTYTAFCHLQGMLPKCHALKSCCLSKTFTLTAMLCKPHPTCPLKAVFAILHTTAKVKCTNVPFTVFICNKIKPQHISQSNVTLSGYMEYDLFFHAGSSLISQQAGGSHAAPHHVPEFSFMPLLTEPPARSAEHQKRQRQLCWEERHYEGKFPASNKRF